MSTENLISVIVPVYKVEPYLDRCVQSIVDQTYTNLEIILVDDGSPDNCPAMCDAWAEKDKRIRVIHKENGGLSDARNAGMAAATGEYIAFVDSDDYVSLDMYKHLLERMATTHSDIVSCGALRVWEDNTPCKTMIHSYTEQTLNTEEAMRALIQSTYLIQTVWNKLYRKEIAKSVPFEKGLIHEDEFWSWQVISKANAVSMVNENYYFYTQRVTGIMGDGYTGEPLLVVRAKNQRNQYIKQFMPSILDVASENLLSTCWFQATQVLRHETGIRRRAFLKELKETAESCEISRQYLRSLKLKTRVRILLIKKSFILSCVASALRGVE